MSDLAEWAKGLSERDLMDFYWMYIDMPKLIRGHEEEYEAVCAEVDRRRR